MCELFEQAVGKPSSERLAYGSRWTYESSTLSAIERMKREDYAFMQATTVMYLQLGRNIYDLFSNNTQNFSEFWTTVFCY